MSSLMLWAWLALAVVISPQLPVVSGTVVDPQGKAVKGATVWLTAFVRIDVEIEPAGPGPKLVATTDAQGQAVIEGANLRRASRLRSVAGRVVDANGKGVPGAEVFQSRDGPKRTSDTTDNDGRFTIPEVIEAPGFVFVRKAGYRFTGLRIGLGDEPVEIVVSKVDGPAPPPLKPVKPPLSRAEERARAHALIAPVWESFHPGEPEQPGPFAKAPTLALVDTRRIIERIEDQLIHPDGPMLANVALGLFEDNPREAAATLEALRPPATAAEKLLDLFDQVPDATDEVRDDLLDRALTRARKVDEPLGRIALVARIADRWFEAGENQKGRRLVDEAREAFKVISTRQEAANGIVVPLVDEGREAFKAISSDASLDARGNLANALAWVDLTASLKLLGPDKNEERLAGVARRAAANNPAGAEQVYVRLTQDGATLGVLANLCAGMAINDVSRARALALRDGAPGVAALTAAAAARMKAADDPDGAKRLLAEAYDLLEPLQARMVVASVSMARLLPLAVRIDPERSSEYLWRAIAARPPRAAGRVRGALALTPPRYFLVVAQLAALVARYDRDAALTIFAPIAENARALMDGRFNLSNEAATILQAAVLFDPRAAEAMVNALPEDPEPERGARQGRAAPPARRVKQTARLVVARALAQPPSARRREALRVPGPPRAPLWGPGQFDLWPAVLSD